MKSLPRFTCSALSIALCLALPPVYAEDAAAQTEMTISRVEVVGSRIRPASPGDIIGSLDYVGRDQIDNAQVDMGLELLKLVPGVYHARFNQGVTSGNIGMRGFNTEGEVMGVKLLVDGIPMNRNSGQAEIDALFPLEIERFEVIKGSQDARYGLHNLAGNVNIVTRRDWEGSRIRVQGGDFGLREINAATGLKHGAFSHSYYLSHQDSDGWREHASRDRRTVAGKWFLGSDDDSWRVGAMLRDYQFEGEAAGYQTYQQSRQQPRQSPWYAAADTGSKDVRQASVHVEFAPTDSLSASLVHYRQHFDTTRFVRFTAASVQQERREDEHQDGSQFTLTWRPDSHDGADWRIDAGLDEHRQDVLNQRYNSVERVRYGAASRDHQYTLDNRGGFVQSELALANGWRMQAGLRLDEINGEMINRQTGKRAVMHDWGTQLQPKAGLLYGPDEQWNLFLNYGRGFQIGTGSAAYQTGPTSLDASRTAGWELGSRFQLSEASAARVAYWRQEASEEVQLKFSTGESENVGQTLRQGLDLLLTAELGPDWYVWGSYTRQQAIIETPGARDWALRGNTLHHVPNWLANVGIDWRPADNWQLTLTSPLQGDYYLSNDNRFGRAGAAAPVNLDVLWQSGALRFGLHLKNLLNEANEYAWLDGQTSMHAINDPFAATLSAEVRF